MKEAQIIEHKELLELEKEMPQYFKIKKVTQIEYQNKIYPIYSVVIGPDDKTLPTLGIFGGVHGLERIGSQTAVSYLKTIKQRLTWDEDFRSQIQTRRIVSIPVVNPWGIKHFHRSNHNGVDLQRNSPVEAEKATFLVGGHRISNKIMWYRGVEGAPMEKESQALIDFMKEEMFQAKVSIALDIHSGFGVKDQLWYPYAKSQEPFPFLSQFKRLSSLFEQTYPHHIYKIEAQSKHYMTHGDMLDYALELQQTSEYRDNIFIPLTLEMGSWNWIKKNPIQLFSIFGLFNPIKQHRYARTMRRHIYLFDFLLRVIKSSVHWRN